MQLPDGKHFHVFLSHASEDKDIIARPLVQTLRAAGFTVWFDEDNINWGDDIRGAIERGINESRYGLILMSPNFFQKNWTQDELSAFFNRQMSGQPVVLPLKYDLTHAQLQQRAPLLAGRKYLELKAGDAVSLQTVAVQLKRLFDVAAALGATTPLLAQQSQTLQPVPKAPASNNPKLQDTLRNFLNTRLTLRAKIVTKLGTGAPFRWTVVTSELYKRGFTRMNQDWIENIQAYNIGGPAQAEAFLSGFCGFLHSTALIFIESLESIAGLESLAEEIRKEAN